jgi:hypothetical protein
MNAARAMINGNSPAKCIFAGSYLMGKGGGNKINLLRTFAPVGYESERSSVKTDFLCQGSHGLIGKVILKKTNTGMSSSHHRQRKKKLSQNPV